MSGSISVIVPALNEASRVSAALRALRAAGDRGAWNHEIILVDGGSVDETRSLAASECDRVLTETGGLARQLNRGAAEATGDTLFFPYVDSRLPEAWPDLLVRALEPATSPVIGGAFRLELDSPRFCFRVIAGVANLRTTLGWGPFGDQAIFARRESFDRLGGFRVDVLLEDLDFVRRLRRQGRFVILDQPVVSSVRRWEKRGVVSTLVRNSSFLVQHALGLNGSARRDAYRRYRASSH